MNAAMARRASSSEWNRWSHRHCSFNVRMKRSITPLHCGSPTNDGLWVMPSQANSLRNASATYCGPQSLRIARPANVFAERAEGLPNALVNRFQCRPPVHDLGHVPAHDVIARVIDRAEEPAPAVPFGVEPRRIGAPHDV